VYKSARGGGFLRGYANALRAWGTDRPGRDGAKEDGGVIPSPEGVDESSLQGERRGEKWGLLL